LLSTTATADPSAAGRTGTQPLEDQLVAATNNERAKDKCAALTVDDRLRTAAQVHSADMASYAYLSHTGHDGSDPVGRMQAAGYPTTRPSAAENVARLPDRGRRDVGLACPAPGIGRTSSTAR
jgi:uncharacterized protein YkwD